MPDDNWPLTAEWVAKLPDEVKALLRIIGDAMIRAGLVDMCPVTRGQMRSLVNGFNREFPKF